MSWKSDPFARDKEFERAYRILRQMEHAATSYRDLENSHVYKKAKKIVDAGGPKAGHQFHFSVGCQGASSVVGDPDSYRDSDDIGDPRTLTVRASSLAEACKRASLVPLNEWDWAGKEDDDA